MIFSKWVFASVLGLAFTAAASSASAFVIDFDSHPDDYENDIIDSGYTFHYDALGWGVVFGDTFSGPGSPIVSNGTSFSIMSGERNGGNARILLKTVNGNPFSITQFDAATTYFGNRGGVEVIGNLQGGGSVSASFDLTDSFSTFVLPDTFVDLDSVLFTNTVAGDFIDDFGVSLDNLAVTPVPEPATIAALGIALVGLSRRKRR